MTSPAVPRADGALLNALSGLGVTGIDPRLSTEICDGYELTKADVDRLMRWEWGCREHVVGLPNSATRKWIRLECDATKKDASKVVLDRLEAWNAKERLREALILERQYGGSGVLIGAEDGGEMEDELELGKLKAVHYLYPVSRWKLLVDYTDLEDDPMSPRFGLPNHYRLTDNDIGKGSLKIHHSRLLIFQGWSPEERTSRYDWGRTILDPFYPTWRDYSSSLSHGVGMGARVNEQRLKIQGLMAMMKSGEWDTIRSIVQELATIRSVFRYTMVDANDSIEDASVEFSGAANIIGLAREHVAGASGRSLQSFFGLTREGLSDRDEGASERDDAAVIAYQADHLLAPCNRLVELAIAVEHIRVKTWQVRFPPLREEAPGVQAQRRLTEAQTAETYANLNAVAPEEIREALRADPDNPYPLAEGSLEPPEPEVEPQPEAPTQEDPKQTPAEEAAKPAPEDPEEPEEKADEGEALKPREDKTHPDFWRFVLWSIFADSERVDRTAIAEELADHGEDFDLETEEGWADAVDIIAELEEDRSGGPAREDAFNPDQPRGPDGRWISAGALGKTKSNGQIDKKSVAYALYQHHKKIAEEKVAKKEAGKKEKRESEAKKKEAAAAKKEASVKKREEAAKRKEEREKAKQERDKRKAEQAEAKQKAQAEREKGKTERREARKEETERRNNREAAMKEYGSGSHPAKPEGPYSEDSLKDGIKRGSGVDVRRGVNELLAEHGIVSRDVALRRHAAGEVVFRSNEVDTYPANGFHESNSGRIQLSTEVSEGLDKWANGDRGVRAIGPVRTLIHESLHGASPMGPRAYRDQGAVIEETTTEVVARKILRERVLRDSDVDWRGDSMRSRFEVVAGPTGDSHSLWGSYQGPINDVAGAISGYTDGKPKSVGDLFERASIRYKKGAHDDVLSPQDSTRRFARAVLHEAGVSDLDEVERLRLRLDQLRIR